MTTPFNQTVLLSTKALKITTFIRDHVLPVSMRAHVACDISMWGVYSIDSLRCNDDFSPYFFYKR